MTIVTMIGRRGPLGQLHRRVVGQVEHRRLYYILAPSIVARRVPVDVNDGRILINLQRPQ